MGAMLDDGGAVGDEEDGLLPILTGREVVEEFLLGVLVEGAGGFVEEYDTALA